MAHVSAERRRASLLLLAVAGALLGHVVGYGVAGAAVGDVHGYLGPTLTLALPLGASALVVWGWRVARDLDIDLVDERTRLTQMMLSVYLVQEIGERALAGHVPAAGELLPILGGLVAQPLVAWLLVAAASWFGWVAVHWPPRSHTVSAFPTVALAMMPVAAPRFSSHHRLPHRRGPPS